MNQVSSLLILILLIGCKSNSGDSQKNSNTSSSSKKEISNPPNVTVPANMTPVSGPPPAKNYPPQNAKGIWHYICPKSCPGGAGEEVPCPKCGVTLVHNPKYHN